MKTRTFVIGVLAATSSAMAGYAAEGGNVVVQKGRAFHPAELTIVRGEPLTFTNDDNYLHQIYVDGLFDSDEKAPGENLKEVFTKAGTFQVRCHIHPTMKMTVVVK
jgi:plastocyanin